MAGRQAQIITLEILNVWMPVPLYLSGVVMIFAFPPLKVRDFQPAQSPGSST